MFTITIALKIFGETEPRILKFYEYKIMLKIILHIAFPLSNNKPLYNKFSFKIIKSWYMSIETFQYLMA